jgi:hypothetical protein
LFTWLHDNNQCLPFCALLLLVFFSHQAHGTYKW